MEWAVATRFQADRDLVIVADSMGSKLDPSTTEGVGAKMGLDATKPLGAPPLRYQRIGENNVHLQSIVAGADWRTAVQG
ncbi:MAG: hypothetical protein K2X43_00605 [Hyphomonadaceae bacterium]|nr:hypothetical protein [Hyphomonadaceae bacterium]